MTDPNWEVHETPAGAPAPLTVGQTVSSASPSVDLGKSKAVVAAVAGVVTAVSVWLTTAPLADGRLDLNEGIALGIAVLGGLGVPGIGAYIAPTSVTRKI